MSNITPYERIRNRRALIKSGLFKGYTVMSIEVDGEHYRHRDQCHHESCYDQAVARLFELFKGIPPISSNVDFTRYPSQAEIKSITSEGEDLIGDELGDCFVIKEVNIKTSNKTVFVHIQMTEPW